jgi:hypothetical protein
MLPAIRKPTAARHSGYVNRAVHARLMYKPKSAPEIVAFCFAKRQTICRVFRLPRVRAVCGRFLSRAQSGAGETKKGNYTMSSKPSHRAYVVSQPKPGTDQKGFWHEVGVVWPHKTGKGFDVVIPEGISVTGRIVCTEPKKDDQQE